MSKLKPYASSLRSYTKHVFCTLTYNRELSEGARWSACSSDFNRYIQRLRRLHCSGVQYIRAIEAHKDGFPHLHVIIQFDQVISVENERYFDQALYSKWKALWPCGLSDYQPPRAKRAPILYLLKYISKHTHTYKSLFRRCYQWQKSMISKDISMTANIADRDSNSSSHPIPNLSAPAVIPTTNNPLPTPKDTHLLFLCKKYKIKQLSWSRKFIFPSLGLSGLRNGASLISDSF